MRVHLVLGRPGERRDVEAGRDRLVGDDRAAAARDRDDAHAARARCPAPEIELRDGDELARLGHAQDAVGARTVPRTGRRPLPASPVCAAVRRAACSLAPTFTRQIGLPSSAASAATARNSPGFRIDSTKQRTISTRLVLDDEREVVGEPEVGLVAGRDRVPAADPLGLEPRDDRGRGGAALGDDRDGADRDPLAEERLDRGDDAAREVRDAVGVRADQAHSPLRGRRRRATPPGRAPSSPGLGEALCRDDRRPCAGVARQRPRRPRPGRRRRRSSRGRPAPGRSASDGYARTPSISSRFGLIG